MWSPFNDRVTIWAIIRALFLIDSGNTEWSFNLCRLDFFKHKIVIIASQSSCNHYIFEQLKSFTFHVHWYSTLFKHWFLLLWTTVWASKQIDLYSHWPLSNPFLILWYKQDFQNTNLIILFFHFQHSKCYHGWWNTCKMV